MSLNIFDGLNDKQLEAVQQTEGALLILAGAGTGKTKVLTSRIVNILNQGKANPTEILAVTFTNKAAREMMHRVEGLLGYNASGFWIGTFHSIGLRILRRHYNEVGLKPSFTILDTGDCESVLKQIMLDKNIDTKKYPPKMVADNISRLKDKNIHPDTLSPEDNRRIGNIFLQEIYTTYQAQLRALNAVDFGDLLLLCIDLFRQYPDVLAQWQNRFKYIMVDEYQDTNALQYLFIKVLALNHGNICAVGDDDQSIYSWRGAEIANILRFEQDFPNAKIIRLEQNYRSTTPILKVASSVISQNSQRHEKTLWSDKESEQKVKLYEAFNSKMEAEFIATTIGDVIRAGYKYNQVAILVRASFLTREIEERLMVNAVPYKFVGGSRFYDRMETKDMIAYLRLLYQPFDDMAFLRIINTPKRGIGGASLDKIRAYARKADLSLFNASKQLMGQGVVSAKIEKELDI
ncbi:MAG: UvrD-helicase domain-containing protein, partial [Alphaproteobacteria bacterium]|nr:UvrD-helicase domain-containing protein [Alphaproteobacteria bacterium]